MRQDEGVVRVLVDAGRVDRAPRGHRGHPELRGTPGGARHPARRRTRTAHRPARARRRVSPRSCRAASCRSISRPRRPAPSSCARCTAPSEGAPCRPAGATPRRLARADRRRRRDLGPTAPELSLGRGTSHPSIEESRPPFGLRCPSFGLECVVVEGEEITVAWTRAELTAMREAVELTPHFEGRARGAGRDPRGAPPRLRARRPIVLDARPRRALRRPSRDVRPPDGARQGEAPAARSATRRRVTARRSAETGSRAA